MHGQYVTVGDIDPAISSIVLASMKGFSFDVHDTLTFYGPNTEYKGTSVVASMFSVNQPDTTIGKHSQNLADQTYYAYDDCDFMQVST